jgi:hypothetical protein
MESTRVSPERITVADEPAPAANDDGPRHGVTDDPVAKEKMQDEAEPPVAVDPGAGLGNPALVLGSRVLAAAWNGADRRRQAIQENSAPARGAAAGPGSGRAWPSARASVP